MLFGKILMSCNRLALCCLTFILSFFICLCTGDYIFGGVTATLAVVLTVVLLAFSGSERPLLRVGTFFLLSLALGIVTAVFAKCLYYYPAEKFLDEYKGKECELTLRVDKADSVGDSYANYNCSILMCNGEDTESLFGVYPSLRLNCTGGDFAEKGDIVLVRAKINSPEKQTGSGFEEEKYLRSRHIFITADYSGEMKLAYEGGKSWLDKIRGRFSGIITRYVGKSSVSEETLIAGCMLLGDRSGVTGELKKVFRAAGLSHVLSISGLHLTLLFAVLAFAFKLNRRTVRRRFVYAEALSCFFIFVYMAIADFTPSIMRAGFMMLIINLYSVFAFYKRRMGKAKYDGYGNEPEKTGERRSKIRFAAVPDSVTALFLAGVIICIVSPYSVFDVGMQLSFASTLGVLIGVSVTGDIGKKIKNPVLRALSGSLVITFSAVSFTLPICVYNFGELSVACASSNIAVAPLMVPLLAFLLLLVLAGLLPPVGIVTSVCTFLGWVCEKLCSMCIEIAKFNAGSVYSAVKAEENMLMVVLFVLLAVFTVTGLFLGIKAMKTAGYFAVVCLYFSYMGVSLAGTIEDLSVVRMRVCTVGQRPYFCVVQGNRRIFFDDTSGVASGSVMAKAFGQEIYDTHNIYLVVPNEYSDFESVYFNIDYFNREDEIDTVLVPSRELCEKAGADMYDYSDFIERIKKSDISFEFYGEEFSVGKNSFTADISEQGSAFTFDEKTVVFAQNYEEEFAARAAGESECCFYFCKNASETSNSGYTSGALLFVTSPLHKNVSGALQIPVRNPVLFE